ncbi:hypothetical protein MGMO_11c00790 [Methyloglobulus morosus KoM1]|uniref:Uncharacterized protein n=1 Tax=Methyloglobulus morosus KoM1 TaxID=1116472 RepID=V5C5M2_9GAMM|nr:hypothetical protein [Methyloglobulus morosus]ESS73772.1 hypothetical protein MGMO_11c00790 [Methyloglobulus morosus KoM1]
MIGGIVGLLALIWVYQTTTKANVTNGVVWVMICAAVYLASQFIMIGAANYIVESMRASEGGEAYERDLTSIGDRKNLGGFQGPKGMFMSVFFELFPPIAGFLLVAFIRTKFVLKEALNKSNLFSGIGDMFKSIKESFKNPDQK